jgi:hypothetical protein
MQIVSGLVVATRPISFISIYLFSIASIFDNLEDFGSGIHLQICSATLSFSNRGRRYRKMKMIENGS